MKKENGIPVPTYRYQLDKLNVNECMTFDVPKGKDSTEFSRLIRCAARRDNLRRGAKYTVRKLSDKQIRVWRTE